MSYTSYGSSIFNSFISYIYSVEQGVTARKNTKYTVRFSEDARFVAHATREVHETCREPRSILHNQAKSAKSGTCMLSCINAFRNEMERS